MIRWWWFCIRSALARRKQEPAPSNSQPERTDDWACRHCDTRVPKVDDLDPGPVGWYLAWTGGDRFVTVCSEACAQRVGAHGVRRLS